MKHLVAGIEAERSTFWGGEGDSEAARECWKSSK